MTLQTSGLTGGGLTTNFQVEYNDSLYTGLPASKQAQAQNNLIANANFMLGQMESAFTTTIGWFNVSAGKFGTSNRQQVLLDQPFNTGANNNGYGNPIHVDGQVSNATVATGGPIVAMLWMAEWAEVLMSIIGNWNAGDSSGEGLSHFNALSFFLNGHNDYYNAGGNQIFVQNWLNGDGTTNQNTVTPNAARSDWVNNTFTGASVGGVNVHGDGDPVSYGCALGFIYYLTTQLSFSINGVISSYSGNLASCYHALSGDSSDPFALYAGLLASVFPPGQTATLTGNNPDNPFPIGEVQFYVQKNTYGKDETQDIINTQGGLISTAFWVVINGFSKQSFQALNIQVAPFTGDFSTLPGVTITANPAGAQFESGVNGATPQTIRIPYDVTLSTPILAQFPASGVSPQYILATSLTSNGTTVSGSNASTPFELIAAADPYFTNVTPAAGNQPYLSQDLRVFVAAPAINKTPFPGAPAFTQDNPQGAYAYIQALLGYINCQASFTNPAGTDPFSLLPDQSGEGQTDSSVAPFAFNFNQFPPLLANNYNFAIARVRLRGTAGPAGKASDVRVFFRVFSSQSADTDYDPNGTYLSAPDAANQPGTPEAGVGDTTIPFFATNNIGSENDYQTNGVNNQTLTIPTGQDDLFWYYGCFLNFYDPTNKIGGKQIQAYLPGTHHCLVAQIAYDDAPIPTGVSPLSWDQLAQRNLQFTAVDNPGPEATHRAPQTFDCRPSGPIGTPGGAGLPPDELMIDWGDIPAGTIASIYWPAVSAAEVISLAKTWNGTTPLTASDAHTLQIQVTGGVSYVPIPSGTGQNFAGLFTLELPVGIKTGQQFEVVARRISTRRGKLPPPPPPPPPPLQSAPSRRKEPAVGDAVLAKAIIIERAPLWRFVVGSFVVRIPVSTGEKMRIPDSITLAIMKWKLVNLSPGHRFAPVLHRFIAYWSAKLEGIGVDPSQIPPSLTWVPPELQGGRGGHGEHERGDVCGKVVEVLFDCHGDFCGFVLDDCCELHALESREREIGELALRACAEDLRLCVRLCEKTGRIEEIAVVRPR